MYDFELRHPHQHHASDLLCCCFMLLLLLIIRNTGIRKSGGVAEGQLTCDRVLKREEIKQICEQSEKHGLSCKIFGEGFSSMTLPLLF